MINGLLPWTSWSQVHVNTMRFNKAFHVWDECSSNRRLDWKLILYAYHISLQWRHNGRDGFSSHQPHHCLLSRLYGRRSKKTSKPRVTGLCAGNSPGTGEFPAQMANNAENVSTWWRHHGFNVFQNQGYLSDVKYRNMQVFAKNTKISMIVVCFAP